MDSTDGKYHFYWSGPFSQWQRSEFEMDGRRFLTAEQAMMYFKAILFADGDTAELIMEAVDPGQQKALGRRVKNFSDSIWNENKFEIVYRINVQKFSHNKGLRRKLFQTGERKLVEASPVDTIWGIGLEASVADMTPETDWPGQNLLGEILTRVRDELRVAYPDEVVQISSTT
ncbi:MAG: NADAR family protein [Pseudomonadota bacterium]